MVKKNYRLQLAKMLKLYKEMNTDNGVLVAEADEIEVGTEVFVDTEEGMTPAQDGEYTDTVENKIYVVAGGTITEIREKENTMEPANEGNNENMEENSDNGENANNSTDGTDTSAEGQDNGEGNQEENSTEDKVKELESALEAANAKIAELEATVSDLEDQVAAYKAKEEETEPSAEDKEKFASQKPKTDFDKTMEAAKLIMKAVKE